MIILATIGYAFYTYNINKNSKQKSNNPENNHTIIKNTKIKSNTFKYNNPDIRDSENFTFCDGFYYKKIYLYKDYLYYKEKLPNILEVNENDFKTNFMIILLTEMIEYSNSVVDNYYVIDNTTLKINVAENNTNATVGNSILIDKKSDRENINIEKIITDSDITSYQDLKSLPYNYSKEQAITDNCYIIDQIETKNHNTELLDKFIADVNNNITSEIRIYHIVTNDILEISDIQYISNKEFNIWFSKRTSGEIFYNTDKIYNTNIDISYITDAVPSTIIYTIKDDISRSIFTKYKQGLN